MTRTLLLAGILPLFPCQSFTQTLTFSRTFGSIGYDDARSVVATPGGDLVFTGLCKSASDADGDLYLTKTNAAGAVLWSKNFGRSQEDGGNHLLPTTDGGFLVTGHTALSYGEACDGYLLKTDANGREIWRSFVGTDLDDVTDCAVEMPDATFWICGRTQERNDRTFRPWLVKIGSNGQMLRQIMLDDGFPAIPYQLALSPDGDLFLAGYAYEPGLPESEDFILMKCSREGQLIWSRRFGTAQNDRAFALLPMADGGCFVAGGSTDEQGTPVSMLAFRFDNAGNQTAELQFPGEILRGSLRAGAVLPGNQLVFAGDFLPENSATPQTGLFVFDLNLNLLHQKTFQLSGESRTRCLALLPGGTVVFGGNTWLTKDETDVFLLRQPIPGSEKTSNDITETSFLAFPNPFREYVYLKTDAPVPGFRLTLTTPAGRLVRDEFFPGNEGFLYREGLAAGVYFFKMLGENSSEIGTGRLAVE